MKVLDAVTDRRRIEIEADPRRLKDAREWAFEVATAAGLPKVERHQMRLAVSEAVANSIQHGSSSAADRIRIEAFEQNRELVFEVHDSGVFEPPRARAGIEDESGRGLELLALITDSVQIASDEDGSLLRFAKRLR